jgi:hypothetical protein
MDLSTKIIMVVSYSCYDVHEIHFQSGFERKWHILEILKALVLTAEHAAL